MALRRLQSGDRVTLVAPASSFPAEEVAAGISELARLGLEAVYDESLFARQCFVAGPAEVRAHAIHRAWADPSIAALVAMRGGYGSAQLLPLLDVTLLRDARKALIGYSDITALHAAFAVRGWQQRVYGSVPTGNRRGGRAGTSLLAALRGDALTRSQVNDAGARVLRPGRASGRLFPACLSVLASLVGTPAMPDLRGCVLAIEDIKVQPFLMATHLNQLHLGGALRGVRALLCGTFTHAEDHDYQGPTPDEVLAQWSGRLRIPAIARLPFGHLDDGLGLPCDRTVRVQATDNGTWTVTINAAG